MINTQIIRNGIASLPKDVQDEVLKLVEKEEVFQKEIFKDEKLTKLSVRAMIPANIEPFDPKEIFIAGQSFGIKFWQNNNFKEYLFDPAKIVESVELQSFNLYENREEVDDNCIRAEVGEQVITPDQLWTAWKFLIFKQPKGEPGTLKTNGRANVWYVLCYDNILRAVDCRWTADHSLWYLRCRKVGGKWEARRRFFITESLLNS